MSSGTSTVRSTATAIVWSSQQVCDLRRRQVRTGREAQTGRRKLQVPSQPTNHARTAHRSANQIKTPPRWQRALTQTVGKLSSAQTFLKSGPPTSKRQTDLTRGQTSGLAFLFDSDTLCVLKTHRALQLHERLAACADWIDADLIISTNTGNRVSPSNFNQTFRRLVDAAGVPRCT
jgi:hypothetical protein